MLFISHAGRRLANIQYIEILEILLTLRRARPYVHRHPERSGMAISAMPRSRGIATARKGGPSGQFTQLRELAVSEANGLATIPPLREPKTARSGRDDVMVR
jgi:hypothetical protein